MKVKVFVRRSQFNTQSALYIFAVVFDLLTIYDILRPESRHRMIGNIVAILVVTTAIFIFNTIDARMGLYICGMDIFYRHFLRMEEIALESIFAIKLSPSLGVRRYGGFYKLKDKQNNQLYSMFLLPEISSKEIRNEIILHTEGDLDFLNRFKKYGSYQCVYDQIALEYLCSLNPDIIIIPAETVQME